MEPLIGHAGSWTGSNRFRLVPSDEPVEAPATACLTGRPEREGTEYWAMLADLRRA